MYPTTPRVISAGLDYVTCTAKSGAGGEPLYELGRALVRDEAAAGNEVQPFLWKGYEGSRAGAVAVGLRKDGPMVQLSGPSALLYGAGALEVAGHASRVDLQMTLHSDEWDVQRLIWQARHEPEITRREGRPIERHLIDNSRTGRTCYIGSAKSTQRGRFYDKHAESPKAYDPGTARLEVQYRREAADAVRARYAAGDMDIASVRSAVGRWFGQRGVLGRLHLPPGGEIAVPPRERTDYERHRQWLRQSVAPALRRFDRYRQPGELESDLGIHDLGSLNASYVFDPASDYPDAFAADSRWNDPDGDGLAE